MRSVGSGWLQQERRGSLDAHRSLKDFKMSKVYQALLKSVISRRENPTVNFLRLVLVRPTPIFIWRLLLLLARTTCVHT